MEQFTLVGLFASFCDFIFFVDVKLIMTGFTKKIKLKLMHA